MSFSFSGKHMNVGASLTHHAAEMCDNVSAKYNVELIDVTVVMEKSSFLYITELAVKTGNGTVFHAKAEEKEPYHSFDSALHKITSQLKKYKSIENDVEKDSIRHKFDIDNAAEAIDDIVKETVETVSLTPQEAKELLIESENTLLVFRNKFTDDINIIYKRPDDVICLVNYK